MWFLFALTFAVFSSFGNIIAKHVMKKMDEYSYLLFSNLFTIPALLAIIFYFYGKIPKVDVTFFLSLIFSTAIGIIAAILAYRAIKISDISLVNPISAFNPVFTAIISAITLKEMIDLKGWLGILLVVLGAYLLQVSKSKKGLLEPMKALLTHKGVQMSLGAYFIWAITPTFEKIAIQHTSPSVPPFASLVGLLISMFFYFFIVSKRSKEPVRNLKENLKFFALVGILGGIGQASAFTAFSLAKLGFATAVFKLSMVFTVILGWVFFKEKNIRDRLLGSFVMLAGVLLLVS